MTPIIEVRNLTKHYGPAGTTQVKAVDGVSFSIPEGTCFGLLGPNGAGKSTTIEMIEGILDPTGGDILYRGKPRAAEFSQQVGIQFQSTTLMDFLSVEETLKIFASFYRKTVPIASLVEQCHLGEFLHRDATKLSGGQKQRLLLALALINDPEIVFLDEPTTGLDPQSRRNFWYLVQDIRARGKTVVLTTHYMDEAEQLCDHLLIMDHGKIIAEGSPRDLLREHFGYVCIVFDRAEFTLDTAQLSEEVIVTDTQVEIMTRSVENTLQTLIARGANLNSLRVRNPTLEDLFLKLTGNQLRA